MILEVQQVVDMQTVASCGVGDTDLVIVKCIENMAYVVVRSWYHTGLSMARNLFIAFAVLELVATGWSMIRKQGELGNLVQIATIKILGMGFIYLLITTTQVWLGEHLLDIPKTFSQQYVAQLSSSPEVITSNVLPDPAALVAKAIGVLGQLIFFLDANLSPLGILLMLIGVIVCAWQLIKFAVELLKTIIECYFIVGAGAVLAGLALFRGTAPIASSYLVYVVRVTLKLFFIMLTAIVAMQLVDTVGALGRKAQEERYTYNGVKYSSLEAKRLALATDYATCLQGQSMGRVATSDTTIRMVEIPDEDDADGTPTFVNVDINAGEHITGIKPCEDACRSRYRTWESGNTFNPFAESRRSMCVHMCRDTRCENPITQSGGIWAWDIDGWRMQYGLLLLVLGLIVRLLAHVPDQMSSNLTTGLTIDIKSFLQSL